ncbi:MAG: hypothetical protein A3F83_12810 [Candidatus Glassbacteria bacterium RIFCSPLOWO2_12_FULL_58_11]|uniref:DUF2339 domain-containing protein n=1 Tax=Candidatus Glassbacteria bacterium RIFCSPLOWO2_12_FULL_58_11 TaxID=1817867 RepID=A0A1F5YLV8_9BACT|nr:MAG: hypothetical protein A3F83_12810 [Candidatus Glassbacteria bacterium RIFCSPLOWO2_12_FULL_58_11]
MDRQEKSETDQRLARLEETVELLSRRLESVIESLPSKEEPKISRPAENQQLQAEREPETSFGPATLLSPPAPPSAAKERVRAAAGWSVPDKLKSGEFWLNKIGIGLLLFGVAFLFKYSIDQGWLTPWARVTAGLLIGTLLFVFGLRTAAHRPNFSQVLLGGAVASFYITGFAAFQVFQLVSHPLAFVFMVAVTVLALVLSLKQEAAGLSLIGALGGLGTPFLLYSGEANLAGLIGYTCLVLAGAEAIFLYRGWRSLQWIAVVGGWLVFSIGCGPAHDTNTMSDCWALEGGIIAFGWLAFWLLTLIREYLEKQHPEHWKAPAEAFQNAYVRQAARIINRSSPHLFSIGLPLAALLGSSAIWKLSMTAWGWIIFGGALVYLGVYFVLRQMKQRGLAYTQALMALLLATLAFCWWFEGDTRLLVLTAEMAVLHLVSARISDRGCSVAGHLLFAALACSLAIRLGAAEPGAMTMYSAEFLAEAALIAAALTISFVLGSVGEALGYRIAGLLLLTLEILKRLEGDIQFLALGAEAVLVQLAAFRMKDWNMRIAGHLLFALAGWTLPERLLTEAVAVIPLINNRALADLAVLASTAAITIALKSREFFSVRTSAAYLFLLHLALLAWLLRELSALNNGQAYVTSAWGGYAIILLILGLRLNLDKLRTTALATLLLVVGKLFLVDLARLEALWRVLLFLCFGGAFLLLSYYFRALWKPPAQLSGKS